MNAWMNAIAELTGIGRGGMDVSLSDLSVLVPDARCLIVIGAVAAFCFMAACQDAWIDGGENRKSDRNRQ